MAEHWRTRLALRLAPWLAPEYEKRMQRLLTAHIKAHAAILRDAKEPAEAGSRTTDKQDG